MSTPLATYIVRCFYCNQYIPPSEWPLEDAVNYICQRCAQSVFRRIDEEKKQPPPPPPPYTYKHLAPNKNS